MDTTVITGLAFYLADYEPQNLLCTIGKFLQSANLR